VAIAEGRHIDVIEMDAASHTGVDDVRDIIEAVRYAAVSARYKIYIIDEVHMLSRNAFNALLKTLEEPPAHVKFLFATTEVGKLPVTVLSRCQRFDLKRIPPRLLVENFRMICTREGVDAEDEALWLIATAAEGSARDGQSILDQSIAHADLGGDGRILSSDVRDMLGLSDKSAQRNLLTVLLAGDGKALLDIVEQQFGLGIEPLALMRGLMEMVHQITVAQVGGGASEAASAEERDAIEGWRGSLKAGQLHRLWQLLLKGHDEVRAAPDPLIAAQMALLRCMHAVDMPDPGTLVKKLEELTSRPAQPAPATTGDAPVSSAPSAQVAAELRWDALVGQIEAMGEVHLASKMRLQVRVVELVPGKLLYAQPADFREDISADLRAGMLKLTGDRWQVERVEGQGAPTLYEQQVAAIQSAEAERRADPLVAATFAAFPDAHFVEQGDDRQRAGGAR
jgi:DNA polymerase-3 subunit gamma/tau